jgi:Arc/MetJ family transcription regulator
MKMTLNIDEALLNRVMEASGITNKTRAVDLALREMDRRSELKRMASEGLGLSARELKEAFDPASYEETNMILAEKPTTTYGRKSRTR